MSYDTEMKSGEFTPELVATGAIEAGSLVVVASGVVDSVEGAIAGSDDSTVIGIAQNDAAIGEKVVCRRAAYALHVKTGDTLVPGAKVFAEDNETVAAAANAAATIPAGVFLGMDQDGKALVDLSLASV